MNNIDKATYALLADNVYWDVRYGYKTVDGEKDFTNSNWTPVPEGWTVLGQFDQSGSGDGIKERPDLDGFSARVYEKEGESNEVVISFAGTYDMPADWTKGNLPATLGKASSHLTQAAELYHKVKEHYKDQEVEITFTGHSLGGGIASVMGVWFDQAAVVFDPAPFKNAVLNDGSFNLPSVKEAAIIAALSTVAPKAAGFLANYIAIGASSIKDAQDNIQKLIEDGTLSSMDKAFAEYSKELLAERSSNITATAVKGEVLEKFLFIAANWIVPNEHVIEGETSLTSWSPTDAAGGATIKHSQTLMVASLLSDNFEKYVSLIEDNNANTDTIKLLFDKSLYGYEVGYDEAKPDQNFLVKLVRNEIGGKDFLTGDSEGNALAEANGMLTHFGNDLKTIADTLKPHEGKYSKLGYDAMIVQSIEWYYNQDSAEYLAKSEVEKQFFHVTNDGNTIQYTTAQGEDPTSINNAKDYTQKWITEVVADIPEFETEDFYAINFDQWNVTLNDVQFAALDKNESQLLLSLGEKVSFTAGRYNDLLLGSIGDDIIAGGFGDDTIYGGKGDDILLDNDAGDHFTLIDFKDNDTLYGGIGDDILISTTGSDILYGGEGFDTYQFSSASGPNGKSTYGTNFVLDHDGSGKIIIDNKIVKFGARVKDSENTYLSEDESFLLILKPLFTTENITTYDLIIKANDNITSGTITVRNWKDGDLDLTLGDAPLSDNGYNIVDFGPVLETGEIDGFRQLDKPNLIYSSKILDDERNLKVVGGREDDIIDFTNQKMSVEVQAQSGSDVIYTGTKNDFIWVDTFEGSLSLDEQYTNIYQNSPPPELIRENPFPHDENNKIIGDWTNFVDSGTGDDHVFGYYGRDSIYGDGGHDILYGAGNEDYIIGGDGNDLIHGDGIVVKQLLPEFVRQSYQYNLDIINSGLSQYEQAHSNLDIALYNNHNYIFIEGKGLVSTAGASSVTYGISDYKVIGVNLAYHSNDYLDGGKGEDIIIGEGGKDTIYGGNDNDLILGDNIEIANAFTSLGLSNETMASYFEYSISDERENLHKQWKAEFSGEDSLYGGSGDDRIYAGSKDDYIEGNKGDDTIYADSDLFIPDTEIEGGREFLSKYRQFNEYAILSNKFTIWGDDTVLGGEGKDTIYGEGGDDFIDGGADNDILHGDADFFAHDSKDAPKHGNDKIFGGTGEDTIYGGGGDDSIDGGDGNDTINGDYSEHYSSGEILLSGRFHGNDNINAGAGNDTVWGGGGLDVINGGSGDDLLVGDGTEIDLEGRWHGADIINGEEGEDSIYGMGGADTLNGGNNNDYIRGDGVESDISGQWHGDDIIVGGNGDDTISGDGGRDNIDGGEGDDEISGDADDIDGQYHNDDTINGGGGNDRIWGAGGSDTIFGGEGNDYIQGDSDLLDLAFHGNDIIYGGAGNDTVYGDAGNDIISGGSGADLLYGNDGDDQILGGSQQDTIFGGNGNDNLSGDEGNDRIYGEAGDDIIYGGDGNDILIGGDGDDILLAGNGQDVLKGGEGSDTYVFDIGDGNNEIKETLSDIRSDNALNFVQFNFLEDQVRKVSNINDEDLLIEFGVSDSITVKGYYLANNTSNDNHHATLNLNEIEDIVSSEDPYTNNVEIAQFRFNDGTIWDVDRIFQMAPPPANPYKEPESIGDVPYFIDALVAREDIIVQGKQQITYGFLDNLNNELQGFQSYSAEQRQAIEIALDKFSDVLNVEFIEDYSSTPDFKFYLDDLSSVGKSAYAGYASAQSGEIHINSNNYSKSGLLQPGEYGFEVLLHEIGHAMGLKHPFEAPVLPTNENNEDNTLMSYTSNGKNDSELKPFDIAALQYLHGVNQSIAKGDNIYSFKDKYIIDANGADTFDASILTDSVTIDLHQGGWSHIGEKNVSILADNQTFISYGTDIENAIGGSGNDTLIGNELNNVLSGGAGQDTYKLTQGGGLDRIIDADADSHIILSEINIKQIYSYQGQFYYGLNGDGLDVDIDSIASWEINGQTYNQDEFKVLVETLIEVQGNTVLDDTQRNAILVDQTPANITGNASDNIIIGNEKDNILDGKAGIDQLAGGLGDDIYIVDNVEDTVIENTNEGNDTVKSGIDYTLKANIENLVLQGEAIVATGNDLNNRLTGNDAANVLDGKSGADILSGGRGDDIYYIDNEDDQVIERDGEGTDTVYSIILNNSLGANLENLYLLDEAVTAAGNSLDNILVGNDKDNIFIGNDGNDQLQGGKGDDTYIFGNNHGKDKITDLDGDNTIELQNVDISKLLISDDNKLYYGDYQTSYIDFASVNHNTTWMINGIDYTIDSLREQYAKNIVSEVDTVLEADQKTGVLVGYDNVTIKGNDLDNTLTGNIGGNTLDGGLGADILLGGAGQDSYVFRVGDGIDEIVDIDGNSKIIIKNANINHIHIKDDILYYSLTQDGLKVDIDKVSEWIISGDTYTSAQIKERVASTEIVTTDTALKDGTVTALVNGHTDISVSGNAKDNLIIGNVGNNILDGGLGADTLVGGAGQDSYVFRVGGGIDEIVDVDNNSKIVIEDANFDHLYLKDSILYYSLGQDGIKVNIDKVSEWTIGSNTYSSAQIQEKIGFTEIVTDWNTILRKDTVTVIMEGNTSVSVIGNTKNNLIIGNNQSNLLDGGSGADILVGGTGNDTYKIDNTGDSIIEFANEGQDTVEVGFDYTLQANVENLILTGSAIKGMGNAANNDIIGNDQDNILDGGLGKDYLRGGKGDDTYIIRDINPNESNLLQRMAENKIFSEKGIPRPSPKYSFVIGLDDFKGKDSIVEHKGSGTDTVISFSSFNLSYGFVNIENLTLKGNAIYGFGSIDDNVLVGNDLDNVLVGDVGDDTYIGGKGNDILFDRAGVNTYSFSLGDGNDIIEFASRADRESNARSDSTNEYLAFSLDNRIEFKNINKEQVSFEIIDNLHLLIKYGESDSIIVKSFEEFEPSYEDRKNGVGETKLSVTYADGTVMNLHDILKEIELNTVLDEKDNNYTGHHTAKNNIDAGEGDDIVYGGSSKDVIKGEQGNDSLFGRDGDDSLLGGDGNDSLFGEDGNDVLLGGDGNDHLSGGSGHDILQGGAGRDTYLTQINDDIYDTDINSTIVVTGSIFMPWYDSGLMWSNNRLEVEGQSIKMDKTHYHLTNNVPRLANFVYDVATKSLILKNERYLKDISNGIDDGDDYIFKLSDIDPQQSENLFEATEIQITNTTAANSDFGGVNFKGMSMSLADFIGLGVTTLNYTEQNDEIHTFKSESKYNFQKINAGAGDDRVYAEKAIVNAQLGDGNDYLEYRSSLETDPVVRSLNNLTSFNNLDVKHQVSGGLGNDIIYLYNRDNELEGYNGKGMPLLVYGDEGDDKVYANEGQSNYSVYLGAGNDRFETTGSVSLVYGGSGNDKILMTRGYAFGEEGDDEITSFHGGAIMDGGAGADILIGGSGNDTFIVDEYDTYIEEGKDLEGGYDTIHIESDFDLSENNFEAVTLLGSSNFTASGDQFDNIITGNSGNNKLFGNAGDDTLIANDGDDHLVGGDGADTMIGGAGNDYYVVDKYHTNENFQESLNYRNGDRVIEYEASINGDQVFGGIDTIEQWDDNRFYSRADESTWVTTQWDKLVDKSHLDRSVIVGDGRYHILQKNIENLILKGDAKVAIGNELDNIIMLNEQNNFVNGLGGNDTIIYQKGGGQDTISMINNPEGNTALIIQDYSQEQSLFIRVQNSLTIRFADSDEYIRIEGYFNPVQSAGSGNNDQPLPMFYNKIDRIIFDNNGEQMVLTQQDIDNAIIDRADNHAPTVNKHTQAITINDDEALNVQFDADTIVDADAWDSSLSYRITLASQNADGSYQDIPDWLNFDADTRTLTGSPTVDSIGNYSFILWAGDLFGTSAGTYLTLTVNSSQPVDVPVETTPDNVVEGTDSSEQLLGTNGNDLINGYLGDDQIFGFAGNDTLNGGAGNDYLAGGNGSGTNSGHDIINGGAGDDTLSGEDGNDILNGGAGNDSYVYKANQGIDIIDNSGGGTDVIFFQQIDKTQLTYHKEGNNLIILVDGDLNQQVKVKDHFLNSDQAIDYIVASDGMMISAQKIAGQLTALPKSDDSNTGGDVDDTTTPTTPTEPEVPADNVDLSGDNTIKDTAGSDRLEGGRGNDTYIYTAGKDTIVDTHGIDEIIFSNGITFNQVGSGLMSSGNDLILRVNGDANNQITIKDYFSNGDRIIETISFETGGSISHEQIFGLFGKAIPEATPIDDNTTPNAPNNTAADIVGTDGNDQLQGTEVDNRLQGLLGDDQLDGGLGNDILIGGTGNDFLKGNAGNDLYYFEAGFGQDIIDNTGGGIDNIYFDGVGFNDIASGLMRSNDDLILKVSGTTDQLTITDFFEGGESAVGNISFASGGNISADQIFGAYGISNPNPTNVSSSQHQSTLGSMLDMMQQFDENSMNNGYGDVI